MPKHKDHTAPFREITSVDDWKNADIYLSTEH